MHSKPIIAGWD